jgi:hypothetical protein
VAVLTLPDAIAGPAAGPRPIRVVKDLIAALPAGLRLAVAGPERVLGALRHWPELAGRDWLAVAIDDDVDFTVWAQDPFHVTPTGLSRGELLFPQDDRRRADAIVAAAVADRLGLAIVRCSGAFDGGNVLEVGDVTLAGADCRLTPALRQALGNGRRLVVLGGDAYPERHLRLRPDADIVEECGGHCGARQPIFHLDAFVTPAGRTEDGRARVLVGDSRLAASLLGEALPAGDQALEHPPIMLKQHDRQAAAQLIDSGATSCRPDESIRLESALADDLDRLAAQLSALDGLAVLRNPLPIAPIVDDGWRAWSTRTLARRFAGVAGLDDVLAALGRRGRTSVAVWRWRVLGQNGALVFPAARRVILPTFAHGRLSYLGPCEAANRALWRGLGYEVVELPDFLPFADGHGSPHCMVKLIDRLAPDGPRPG